MQGTCAAMMKKHVQYVADVLLGDDSVIVGCQCECAAGEGPNAHCKHIVAVMCAMIDLQTEGILNLRKTCTCTQKLQAFHQPSKEYFGSPVKSEDLPRGSHNRTDKLNFNPIDSASVNSTEYNDRVRNLAINFCSTNISTMPLMHAYIPANLYGVNKDHTYGGDPEDLMLQHLKVRKVSSEDVAAIEEATRQQAGSTLWHEMRTTHLTCSNFYDIIHCVSDRAKVNLAMRLMSPTPFISKYTQHGKDCEPIAIKEYEAMGSSGFKTQECGFFISEETPFLGGTPDRILPLAVVEVKCPYNQRLMIINEETIPFLCKTVFGNLALRNNCNYYYPIQGQMYVTGKPFANLIVYTFKDLKVIDVPRDEEFICQMVLDLKNYYEPNLMEKHLYKNYGTCFFK